jgi:hypothetical protein
MPEKIDWQLIKDATANVKKLMKAVTEESYRWPRPTMDSECVFYLKEMEKPSWKSMLKEARKRRKSYDDALTSISRCTADLKEMENHFKPIDKMYSLVHTPKPRRVDEAKTRKSITASFLKIGVSLKQIDTVLKKSSKKSSRITTSSYFHSFIGRKEQLIASSKPELLKSLMAAILAEAVAAFNLQAKNVKDKVTVKGIGKWCINAAKKMDAAESGIYKALSEKNFAKLPERSGALSAVAQKTLDEGLQKGVSAQQAAKTAKAASVQAWGDVSLEVADVLRMALRGLALANFLKHSVGDERTLSGWARNAAKLAHGDISSPIKSHTVSEVEGLGLRAGQSIAVRGRVNDLFFVQINKDKIVSLADIVDGSGNHISAVLPYFKMNSCGLVAGSSVRVTGTFDPQAVKKHLGRVVPKAYKQRISALNPEGLIIDRLNYGELARTSWRNWVTRELAFMFSAVPHGLNISWSWQTGENGPVNQLCFGTWCGR